MPTTITEALAEVKTIDKRIAKKREFITAYLARQERFKDPLASDGGSMVAIGRERQAIRDLEQRKVDIRLAIAAANNTTVVAVNGDQRSISEWLVWRREVAPQRQSFLQQIRNGVQQVRREAQQKGINVLQGDVTAGTDTDVHINVNENDLATEIEKLEQVLGDLDGQLSLKNATVTIDI